MFYFHLNNRVSECFPDEEGDVDDDKSNRAARRSKIRDSFILGGELKFTLGLTRTELEVGQEGNSQGHILRRVLGKGISAAIRAESLGFNVAIEKLILNEVDGGATEFNVEFNTINVLY